MQYLVLDRWEVYEQGATNEKLQFSALHRLISVKCTNIQLLVGGRLRNELPDWNRGTPHTLTSSCICSRFSMFNQFTHLFCSLNVWRRLNSVFQILLLPTQNRMLSVQWLEQLHHLFIILLMVHKTQF